jgi:hypothetical protein
MNRCASRLSSRASKLKPRSSTSTVASMLHSCSLCTRTGGCIREDTTRPTTGTGRCVRVHATRPATRSGRRVGEEAFQALRIVQTFSPFVFNSRLQGRIKSELAVFTPVSLLTANLVTDVELSYATRYLISKHRKKKGSYRREAPYR